MYTHIRRKQSGGARVQTYTYIVQGGTIPQTRIEKEHPDPIPLQNEVVRTTRHCRARGTIAAKHPGQAPESWLQQHVYNVATILLFICTHTYENTNLAMARFKNSGG